MIKRAAFASRDGDFIDYHYGRATSFFIYELGSSRAPILLGKRRNYRIPVQGAIEQGAAHRRENLEKVAELLSDCDALFVAKIGETPAKFFIERGMRVFQIEERIDRVLEEIGKENEKNTIEGNV
jgi:predicted Fe-Mo cluster-binding NifX family protein